MLIILPRVLAVDEAVAGNLIQQIGEPSVQVEGTLAHFTQDRLHGFIFREIGSDEETLIVPRSKQLWGSHSRVLTASIPDGTVSTIDLSAAIWLKHPLLHSSRRSNFDYAAENDRVLVSWIGAFSYIKEDPAVGIKGLRTPQIGAVHRVHSHWAVSEETGTIVMPTGTGKTETMLSILVSTGCPKLLVIVPTDALRSQIAGKFLTLGALKEMGSQILTAGAKTPIVGVLHHIPADSVAVDALFEKCHVIVTTSSVAGQCTPAVQNRMARHCPYLFIDEAHHAEAPTWKAFKERFKEGKILQFTATPFREDGKPLDGDIIFKYPLKKAQQEGYFKPIRFLPVVEFNPKHTDEAIAAKAIEQLRADFDRGHVLMARAENVARAQHLFNIYSQYAEFNPVQLHTGVKSARKREQARKQIISGESRIVVCVDMLGEGFDLPELKIAAFHDIRKSLAVTLQLAGRFTRSRPDLGEATFIANTADVNVQHELRKLYTRDPDWNVLLPELSDRMIGEQLSLQEFLRGFTDFTKEIPLKTVRPATSTVVYRTFCKNWTPENFRKGIPTIGACEQVHETINRAEHTLIVVTARRVPLDWTDVESLYSWEWELYVVIWSPDQNLLFINSSTNSGEYRDLAEAVAGNDAVLIQGQDVFRTFAGVNRLRLQNVGLTEQLGRNVRYTGRMGADVEPALTDAQRRRTRKSVLSGSGYEGGQEVTVGASRKGRIWSHRRDRVDQLAIWCKQIGAKLLDATINPDEVLKGTLDAKTVTQRPAKMPISADWPEEMYKTLEAIWFIAIDGQEWPLNEVSIELADPSVDRPLRIAILSETDRAELELELFEENDIPNYRFVARGNKRIEIRRGGAARKAESFFYNDPPVIWFSDGSALEGNQYIELKVQHPPYDLNKIEAWDWTGVNIRNESQGITKDASSIQARVIRELRNKDYKILVDDDGKGETADIVAISLAGNQDSPSGIHIEFYHCKFSGATAPGRRIKDLYEVCGQAQKCISWMVSPEKRTDIFTHLLRREAKRQYAGGPTRFEVGDKDLLLTIREMSRLCPITLSVYIVQPGMSKANATRDQLQLLSVTENHLHETFQLAFGVIASP